MPDLLPRRDADLLTWSAHFDQVLSTAAQDYGISAEQSAAYSLAHARFAQSYRLANQPGTRTPVAITSKDLARTELKKLARVVAGIVRANRIASDTQRVCLGLRPRKKTRTPIGKPTSALGMSILDVRGARVSIRLFDPESPFRTAKPRGAAYAIIYAWVGQRPPADPRSWGHVFQTTRTSYEIKLGPATRPGEEVWIAARWINPRGMAGPICMWQSTHVQFGDLEFAAGLKAAA
jgi:hypothetical protein